MLLPSEEEGVLAGLKPKNIPIKKLTINPEKVRGGSSYWRYSRGPENFVGLLLPSGEECNPTVFFFFSIEYARFRFC